jgi:hypothetical protein
VNGPPAVELAWSRGPGAEACIDGRELAAEVQATIGRPVLPVTLPVGGGGPPSLAEGSLQLEGKVQPLGRGWMAVVEVRALGPELRREVALDAPECRRFDEALVLVVALLAEAALPTAPRLTLPTPSPSVSVGIGPDFAVTTGMLPGVAVGFGLATEVALPPLWHLAAWAHAWPISKALDGGSGGGLSAWTFGAAPCIGPVGRQPLSFFGCVGASGGVVYASGEGLEVSHTSSRPYLQAEIRAGLRMRIAGPVFLRLEAGVGVPIARDSYQFTGTDGTSHAVFETAPVVALGRLAVEFRAP